MATVLGWLLKGLIFLIQALPLTWVARLGRIGGAVAWVLDARHRRVAIQGLQTALGNELPNPELRRIAREHFRRLGENYACAVKTAGMSDEALLPHVEVIGSENIIPAGNKVSISAIGHFGNFEALARIRSHLGGCQLATTYRALKHPAADGALQSLRRKSGTLLFERTRDAAQLRQALNRGSLILGLLADQHAGNRGLWLPFFGTPCSTNPAPAIYALRYDTPIVVGICYRTALARWRIEFGRPIPTRTPDGAARTPEELMLEVNRQYEAAIRRDPANWFWVHRRWKPPSPRQRSADRDSETPV